MSRFLFNFFILSQVKENKTTPAKQEFNNSGMYMIEIHTHTLLFQSLFHLCTTPTPQPDSDIHVVPPHRVLVLILIFCLSLLCLLIPMSEVRLGTWLSSGQQWQLSALISKPTVTLRSPTIQQVLETVPAVTVSFLPTEEDADHRAPPDSIGCHTDYYL